MTMTEITTNEALNEFLNQADSFHDAIIRECGLVARGYVDEERWLHGDTEPFNARVFLQTQFDDVPGIEIEFDGVTRFCVDRPFGLRPSGFVEEGRVNFSFTALGAKESQIAATAMRYRFLDKTCLGEKRLIAGDNPSSG